MEVVVGVDEPPEEVVGLAVTESSYEHHADHCRPTPCGVRANVPDPDDGCHCYYFFLPFLSFLDFLLFFAMTGPPFGVRRCR